MTAPEDDPKGSAPAKIDLNQLVRPGEFEVSIKPAENEQDANVRRFKEKVTFILAAAMTAVIFFVCLGILLFGHPSAEEQRWVQSALTLILGAAVSAGLNKK